MAANDSSVVNNLCWLKELDWMRILKTINESHWNKILSSVNDSIRRNNLCNQKEL